MRYEFKMPRLGMGIAEGAIICWHKDCGDYVAKGETLVEIESAKAIVEISSPVSGSLIEILVAQGDVAAIGTTIALFRKDE